jgi:hypothetical protein
MKDRIKDLYLEIGHVLNNPTAFGLEERMPKALAETLSKIQSELLEELRAGGLERDFLDQELSQDTDRREVPGFTSISFELPMAGT